jgi:hypothetical protein
MKRLFTTAETKRELGIGTTQLYDEINEGKLDALKAGRRTYITGASIERRIAEMKPFETPKMKAKAALEGRAESGDPQPLKTKQSDRGGDRQSPRSRFGFA